MDFDEKTEKIKDQFKARTSEEMKPTGPNKCDITIEGKRIWEGIEEVLEVYKKTGDRHLDDDIDRGKELFHFECPKCGEGRYFVPA
jgi:benzoyl-CoA reductase/2-hydroxyglutaryl-CoA dehydratase subunit BcrC/BadD/HgdB